MCALSTFVCARQTRTRYKLDSKQLNLNSCFWKIYCRWIFFCLSFFCVWDRWDTYGHPMMEHLMHCLCQGFLSAPNTCSEGKTFLLQAGQGLLAPHLGLLLMSPTILLSSVFSLLSVFRHRLVTARGKAPCLYSFGLETRIELRKWERSGQVGNQGG